MGIDEEEIELLAKLEAIRTLKRERAEKLALENEAYEEEAQRNNILVVTVKDISPQRMVLIEAGFRPDMLRELKATIGRTYAGNAQNSIPIAQWENFVERIEKLPKLKIVGDIDVMARLAKILAAPDYEIKLGKYEFEVTSLAVYNVLGSVAGHSYDQIRKLHKIPFSEGWKLYEVMEGKKVSWTDEARAFVINQVTNRAKLDVIATMERSDKYADFDANGLRLRDFQSVSCEFADATNGRFLLADEMGLGKSPQAIVWAHYNKLRTLFVVPASLKNNWARQIIKFTGINPRVLRGAEPSKMDIVDLITDPKPFTIINYDILGRKVEFTKVVKNAEGNDVSEEKVSFPWVEYLNMAKFDLVVYDEAHYFKNVDSNRSQAVRKMVSPKVLPMTGTPVMNRPGELWPILHMINPHMFPAYETFIRQYTYDGKNACNIGELRNTMKTMMIRRLKKDVKKDLEPINRIHEFRELSPKAMKLYEKVLRGVYTAIDASGIAQDKKIANILVQIQRLKQVCALDMATHTADLAVELYDQTDDSEKKKVLIFTQYKMVAYKIGQLLGDEALCFVRRNGNEFTTADIGTRDDLVQEFQKGDKKFLVVTEKTTKEGHDITEAGHVICNDLFWTPAAHEQAEGRAYGRESDSHNINSYYMVTDMAGKSINEWIMTLLAEKMRIIEEVVEGVEGSRDASVFNDIIQKLKEFR